MLTHSQTAESNIKNEQTPWRKPWSTYWPSEIKPQCGVVCFALVCLGSSGSSHSPETRMWGSLNWIDCRRDYKWLFVSVWPCNELPTCPGRHPALSLWQLQPTPPVESRYRQKVDEMLYWSESESCTFNHMTNVMTSIVNGLRLLLTVSLLPRSQRSLQHTEHAQCRLHAAVKVRVAEAVAAADQQRAIQDGHATWTVRHGGLNLQESESESVLLL